MDQQTNFPEQKPENYLVWAILATALCCLPTGIYAILQANKVNEYYAMQQYDLARQASADAKKWTIISAVAGISVGIIYAILVVAAGIGSAL